MNTYLVTFSLPYARKPNLDANLDAINKLLISGPPIVHKDEKEYADYYYERCMLLDDFLSLIGDDEINYKVSKPIKIPTEIIQRETIVVNERCGAAVPGNQLLNIVETMATCDCCTETLNRHLQNGWHIVAVCPQPDQRRPDYVLGRFVPEQL